MNPFSTIKDLKIGLKNKEFSPKELFDFYQNRLKKYNDRLNVALSFQDTPASFGEEGLLAGIPCLVKDNVCMKDVITTAGSKILTNFKPSYDAHIISEIRTHGGSFLGKSNMDEFAMGGSGEFSAFGAAKNPWNIAHSPGGSSSGSAAAVAAGLAPWAIGTETGGSVRGPAAFCGLVGMYPTYGLVSRFGLLAFGSSLDQAGAITRTVYDNALVMSVLAGHDAKDSTSLPESKIDYTKKLDGKLPRDLTIGVLKDSFGEGVDPEIRAATERSIKILESMGAKIKTIELPSFKYAISVYFITSRAEAASNLARIDGSLYGVRKSNKDLSEMYLQTRDEGFGLEVKRRILLGNYVLSSAHRNIYEKANLVRALIRNELDNAFEDVDVIVAPTSSSLAFKLGEMTNDPIKMYLSDYFVLPNCVAGYPAISVPSGLSKSGLPIGIQFMGPKLSEEKLFITAHAFEQNSGHHNMHPQGFNE